MSGNHRKTRRRFLAGLGAVSSVAVAGCSTLPWEDDGTATSLRMSSAEAGSVRTDDEPMIEWPAPIRPAESALEDGLERVDALLADVPDSLGPDDVPNGVVRESIAEKRDVAIDTREDGADATGAAQYHAFRETRDAREAARHAATTWLAIDAERQPLVAELRDERDAVNAAVTDRHEALEYRGTDTAEGRLRACLYYYQHETDLAQADRILDRWSVAEADDVLKLGESASTLEFATATTTVWEHLDARWLADDETVGLESTFEDALEHSIAAADEVGFPAQDDDWFEAIGLGDLDDQYLEFVLWRAGQPVEDAQDGMREALREGDLATGLYNALGFEVAYRGFETVRDRIADGDVRDLSVEDVRAERREALAAAQQAREAELEGGSLTEPSLGAYILAETLRSLVWVDDSVRRAADREPETTVSLTSQYRDYVRHRSHLETLPDAIEAVRARLLE
ncbi:transposase [Haloterrigena sp. H1]|uniref:transposase n=1 Tax=Haloterrigena sp. H1 TaxID=2552943 RepID=UPI00110DCBA1|nr:transposase [Haloterrigena sp. H1]TMT86255.1 transposase [Haloterrigena sp. H1]